MKRRVFKPIGFGAAAGALTAGLFGQRHAAARLIFALILLSLRSLGAPEAFRRSVSRMTSRRQVRANACTAAIIITISTIYLVFITPFLTLHYSAIRDLFPAYEWTTPELRRYFIAAGSLLLTRILTVTFDAAGDRTSVLLTELLSFAAVAGSLLMFRNTAHAPDACMIACAALALLTALIGGILHKMDAKPAYKPPMQPFLLLRDVPAGLLRVLILPALLSFIQISRNFVPQDMLSQLLPDAMSIPLLSGFAAVELLRTDHRRDRIETPPMRCAVSCAAFGIALLLVGYLLIQPAPATVLDTSLPNRIAVARLVQTAAAVALTAHALYLAPTRRTLPIVLFTLVALILPIRTTPTALAAAAVALAAAAGFAWGRKA